MFSPLHILSGKKELKVRIFGDKVNSKELKAFVDQFEVLNTSRVQIDGPLFVESFEFNRQEWAPRM